MSTKDNDQTNNKKKKVAAKKIDRLPRTRSTPLNGNRMHPDEMRQGMELLSENVISNVTFVIEERGITWKEFGVAIGLSSSTIYGVKNFRFNAGTASAVQFAKGLGVEAWSLFLPHAQFKRIYKKIQQQSA